MLRTTHTSTVTEDQIDHLGHMNVRFYAVNAHAGTRAVLDGLPWGGRGHVVHDTYTRHHREQLLGTDLEVRSAILSADQRGLRLHHELRARATDELAATFVHGISPLDGSGHRLPLPEDVAAAALAAAVPLPEHAAPRSISLDADLLVHTPTLEVVRERGLAMRRERDVSADECDDRGRYRVEMAPMLTWGGQQVEEDPAEILHETADGVLMGWASMETRVQVGKMPTVGDRIQSFGAGVAIHDKVMHRVHWAFDVRSGELLTAFESISMAFDIRGRRPMSIPDGYRQRALTQLQPDLAPQSLL
jgi:acyl-CoA thioesterase FadM